MQIRRLSSTDRALARELFALMADVFDEPAQALSDAYLDRLLARSDFWAVAALEAGAIVGGITAHTLPMTRVEASELFIYDIAVRRDRQRRGIGRGLLAALRDAATAAGIRVTFVFADDDDAHALDFYRAMGAEAAPVTSFTFSDEP